MVRYQRSTKRIVSCTGIGLHSGQSSRLTLIPAPVDTGIVFVRRDRDRRVVIKAHARSVISTELSTTLGEGGVVCQTVEHLLGAMAGLGVDNLYVEIDSPEIPIMDGSAAPFVVLLVRAGIIEQEKIQPHIKILKEITVQDGDKWVAVRPAPVSQVTYSISYNHPLLQEQSFTYFCSERNFVSEVARARTFAFLREVDSLRARGLAQGGSLDNTIVVGDTEILNKEGLRYQDEFVRHKVLDLLGDLTLLGMPLIGHVVAVRSGHSLHSRLVSKILREKNKWAIVDGQFPLSAHRNGYPPEKKELGTAL